jgi:hypothetical protein
VRAAQELFGAPTLGWGSEWQGGESKKSNKPSKPPKMYKNGTKVAGLPTLIDLKIIENDVFYLNILNKIYS